MKLKLLMVLAMLAFCAVDKTYAGGLQTPQKAEDDGYVSQSKWTGFHAGITGASIGTSVEFKGLALSNDQYTLGGYLGYDALIGNFMVAGVRGDVSGIVDDGELYTSDLAYSVSARLGALITGSFLVFLEGGYMSIGNGDGVPDTDGFMYGIGMETRINHLILSATVLRMAEEESVMGFGGVDFDNTIVRGSIGYKF